MKIVIIGANGFIGKNLSIELSKISKADIYLVSRRFDDVINNIKKPNVTLIKLDYRSEEIKDTIKGADFVYFLVSSSVPSTSWLNPANEIINNIYDVVNFFELLSQSKIGKVIYLSSGGTVYGNQAGKLTEESNLLPFSPYGISKYTNERFLEYFRIKSGLNYTIYRISNVYGSYSNKDNFGVINTWLKKLILKEPIEIFGSAPILKDYIYVNDVAKILRLTLQLDVHESEIMNLCSGELYSLLDIINMIKEVTNIDFTYNVVESKSSDNKVVNLDNKKLLSYFPDYKFTTLHKGLKNTWEDFILKDL